MASASGPRMTLATQLVLGVMLEKPGDGMYGLEICRAAGLPSGTIHPILARLEGCGWLESHWEDIDPAKEGRPRRRFYCLTREGAECARSALDRVHTPPALLRARLAGGAL